MGRGSAASQIFYGDSGPRTSTATFGSLELPEAWLELGQRLDNGYRELKKLCQQTPSNSNQRMHLATKLQGLDIAIELYKNTKERYQERPQQRWEFFNNALVAAAEAENSQSRKAGIRLGIEYQQEISTIN